MVCLILVFGVLWCFRVWVSEFVVLCDWRGADSSCFLVVTFWFLGLAWVWLSGFGGSAVYVGFGLVLQLVLVWLLAGCCE